MLAIEVLLLTGRYVATSFNDRRRAEWPPHPARLFSALVATCLSAEPVDPAEQAALEWLEALPAPGITAGSGSSRDVVTVFVPVNDTHVVGEMDVEVEAVDRARLALSEASTAKERATALKVLEKAEKKLAEKVDRATSAPVKPPSAAQAREALKVLPDLRTRQPRTFPSVTPEDPRVLFTWLEAAPSDVQRRALDSLLGRMVRLGHSSCLVSARLVDDPAPATWVPQSGGERQIRVTRKGQLAALVDAHGRHGETEPRVLPATFQAYGPATQESRTPPASTGFSPEWLLLRRVAGPRLPSQAAVGLARTLRKTLLSLADAPIPEVLSGHRPDGTPSERDHLAIVALPFVGSEHATGHLMGLALVFPRDVSPEERRSVYRAIDAWERAAREPEDEDDAPVLPIHLGRLGDWSVQRVEEDPAKDTLRSSTWCRPSRTWCSVTPVALDRNPGDLGSRRPDKLEAAIAAAIDIVGRSVTRIGLPEPSRIEILPAAPLPGAAKAREFGPYPNEPGKHPRVLTHVLIEFSEPVRGPVLLGAGRYLGLGLMRPCDDRGNRP